LNKGNAYGLKSNILTQWETLAQSLSSIAPTASPAAVIPLVIAVSGSSSWIAYMIATVGSLLVAFHVNIFASDSVAPGSLYSFVVSELNRWAGLVSPLFLTTNNSNKSGNLLSLKS